MSIEEQIQLYKELTQKITEMEEKKKELSLAILKQMTQKKLSIAGYTVCRYDRLSIKTSLEEARKLHATKMEEVLDKDKLKQLYQLGESISGVSSIQFIQVLANKNMT